MLFASELLTYVFKFVVLLAIAVGGAVAGVKFKKSKLDKEQKQTEE